MKNKFLRKVALTLLILLSFSFSMPAFARKPDIQEGEILCFGADLNHTQEESLREYFNAPDNIDAVYVDNTVASRQLGYSDFTGGWYSSAYVKINESGTGINVKSNNLTLVTDGMLANALITSGITDADIIASAPFPVTGESALAGIFEGAERIIGIELKPEGKQVAQEEVEVTLDIADSIGSVEATALINEVKARVIKEAPKTTDEINEIVSDVSSNLDITINDVTKEKIVLLMNKINDLDIDYDAIKDSIKQNSSKLLEDLKSLGNEIKESGILERLWNWLKNFIDKWTNSQ
ncbi:DUF1002 domain-containing protein [Clostridium sp. NSJ-6]|uniref:DUF1002 domain-containing protein n=1 Tax=Clostridium hominis TaxID=2763036 RepID=A0ABR7DA83_9CLOT|nr:DUF1002 domain-containing protein [Clostridium hominis]MBC5628294.1 DUF1002 domain-containing protein [Clostridium hominis]MDU2671469.1 DUF1002 domain-containing protein [Clostridium sp.]